MNEEDTFRALKSCSMEEMETHIKAKIEELRKITTANDIANHPEIDATFKKYGWTRERFGNHSSNQVISMHDMIIHALMKEFDTEYVMNNALDSFDRMLDASTGYQMPKVRLNPPFKKKKYTE